MLSLDISIDNGGSVVTEYVLQRNQGTSGSAFTNIPTYTSGDLTHTVSTTNDGLTTGTIYTFRWYAKNAFGDGEVSNELTVALSA